MTVAQVLSRPAASWRYLLPLLVLLALCGVAIALAAGPGAPPPRELVLVARDMAFYLPGDPAPNPTLVLGRGERVRLVLRNEDPGMAHDFAAAGLDVTTELLEDSGTSATVVFRAPQRAGEYPYHCTPHASLMRGVVLVR
jgi:hypothetical protein